MQKKDKTLIGVLASHDDLDANQKLVTLLNTLVKVNEERLSEYGFIFTGSTFDRVILGKRDPSSGIRVSPVNPTTRKVLLSDCGVLRLPKGSDGGVIVLSHLVVQRRVRIVWQFYSPRTVHWLKPENLSLMRLCDRWSVKSLMNSGSVIEWFNKEGERDIRFNRVKWFPRPETIPFGQDPTEEGIEVIPQSVLFSYSYKAKKKHKGEKEKPATDEERKGEELDIIDHKGDVEEIETKLVLEGDKELKFWVTHGSQSKDEFPGKNKDRTIALIAHDDMKPRMLDFATQYQRELAAFKNIITTGTTGKRIKDTIPSLAVWGRIYPRYSGPEGGDIEIATQVLFGKCHVVIFFIDPLKPHPHIDDIRVVFAACMLNDEVRMFSNETQAREWFEMVIRRR